MPPTATTPQSATNLRAAGDRIEQLLGQLRTSVDPEVWNRFEEVLSLVTELYGAGLGRVMELIVEGANADSGGDRPRSGGHIPARPHRIEPAAPAFGPDTRIESVVPFEALIQSLVEDELVASLLVLHGLHPDDLAARVERALTSTRPYLASHGGDVELIELDGATGSARLRLLGSCDGCPSSSATLRYAVEQAIAEAAPEIVRIEVEGLDDEAKDAVDPLSIPVTLSRKPAGVAT